MGQIVARITRPSRKRAQYVIPRSVRLSDGWFQIRLPASIFSQLSPDDVVTYSLRSGNVKGVTHLERSRVRG